MSHRAEYAIRPRQGGLKKRDGGDRRAVIGQGRTEKEAVLDPRIAHWLSSSGGPAGMEMEQLHRDPRYICTATFDHSTSLAHLKLEARRRTE